MSVFAVSKVRLDAKGRVTRVQWGVVDTKSNRWVSPEVEAPAADVLEAIRNGDQVVALFPTAIGHVPGRRFVAVYGSKGGQSLALEGPREREISDMAKIDR